MVEIMLVVNPYVNKDTEELLPMNDQTTDQFVNNRLIQADHRPVVFLIIIDGVPAGTPVMLRKAERGAEVLEVVAKTVTKMDNSLGIPVAKIKVWIAPSDNGKIWTAFGRWKKPHSGQGNTNRNPITVYQTGEHLPSVPEPNFIDDLLIKLGLKQAPLVITTRAEVFSFPYKWIIIGGLVVLLAGGSILAITRMK